MRTLAITTLIAAASFAAVATNASAAPQPMSDGSYIAVARCAGMAEGLGADATAFNKALNAQEGYRTNDVVDRADQSKSDAKQNARHAGEDSKTAYQRELSGTCQGLVSAG